MNDTEIAIVGVGCRFPGATCLREFWDVLLKGENHVVDIPPDRFDKELFCDLDMEATGKMYVTKGGFIKNYAHFDNELFGISENEAIQMDPQQRHVLECTYMALENAGIPREQISGQKVGVFLGSMNSDFVLRMTNHLHKIDNFSILGLSSSLLANRVSYAFNLFGPSMVMDTACSSSMVALHQACLSLRAGDCCMAVTGGVNLMLVPSVFIPLSKARMLSPTGQCHAFSADADGYVRGEGCGIVILKTLEQALQDNDNIWATIRTGLNQDGHAAQPITAPSGSQQKQLIEEVVASSGVDPNSIDYIEAHGTGTKAGDPTEINTFGEFFSEHGQLRKRYLGSVKTNIGHLEPAAGIASLIKVLLMMKNNTIVPSLHFKVPNGLIDFDRYGFIVPTKNVEWSADHKIACLNSFGFGGSNSHAIVQSFNQSRCCRSPKANESSIVCFSGRSKEHLITIMQQFGQRASEDSIDDIRALSYTSTKRRDHFKHRKAFLANDVSELTDKIQTFQPQTVKNPDDLETHVIFVFCGMGTAWKGMCVKLMGEYPIIKVSLEEIDSHLQKYTTWSLVKRILDEDEVLDPMFGPIAIFGTQIALARLWMSIGIKPNRVVGQSIGEVAAAHVAGILSLADAVKIIYHRTRILAQATGGKMLLVRNAPVDEVENICQKIEGVNVALYYSPISCTVSGDSASLQDVKCHLQLLSDKHTNLYFKELDVTSAFHSRYMDPCKEELDSVLLNLSSHEPQIPMISCLDPSAGPPDIRSHEYWGKNVRSPVQFFRAVQSSVKDSTHNVCIEIGPNPVLGPHLPDIISSNESSTVALASMTNKVKENPFLSSVAILYELNFEINWQGLFEIGEPLSPLPCYSFCHSDLMALPTVTYSEMYGPQLNPSDHLFVESHSSTRCSVNITPFNIGTIYEHKVKDIIVIPGVTYVEAAFGIAKTLKLGDLENMEVSCEFSSPVTLRQNASIHLDVDVEYSETSARHEFTVQSGDVCHARGTITASDNKRSEQRVDMEAIRQKCTEKITGEQIYNILKYVSFTYGENFATIDHTVKGNDEALTKLKIGDKILAEMKRTVLHPAVLDSMLQAAACFETRKGEFLPAKLENVRVRQSMMPEMYIHTRKLALETTESDQSFSASLLSGDGLVLASIGRLSVKYVGSSDFDVGAATFLMKDMKVQKEIKSTEKEVRAIIFTEIESFQGLSHWLVIKDDCRSLQTVSSLLDAMINEKSVLCVLFPVCMCNEPSGEVIQKEIIDRLMKLKTLILYLSTASHHTPMVIISERRSIQTEGPSAVPTHCINQGVTGFVRCALREHRKVEIQIIEREANSTEEFLQKLPEMLSCARSEEFKEYPEMNIQGGIVFTDSIIPCEQPTPQCRNVQVDRWSNAVLCSRNKAAVKNPVYFQATEIDRLDDRKLKEMEISSHAMHNPSLLPVTQASDSVEDASYPVLTLESLGRISNGKMSNRDSVAFYPSMASRIIKIPKTCVISKDKIPNYVTGDLIKLYTLWNMCKDVENTKVYILHSTSTLGYAAALSVISKSRKAKLPSLIHVDDLANGFTEMQNVVIISTVMITKDMANVIVSIFQNVRTVVALAGISDEDILGYMSSLKPSLEIRIISQKEIFLHRQMFTLVPLFFKWIKANPKLIRNVVFHLRNTRFENCTNPINIAQLLSTTEFNLSKRTSCDVMKTRSMNLFQKSGSYIVVGGLTGLGWECVSYICEKGAGRVVIMSRSKPNPEKINDILVLARASTCQIQTVQADVTSATNLENAFCLIQKLQPFKPIKGIFFGAATLEDALLSNMTKEKLAKVMSPKVIGIWNMHTLTSGMALDFFIVHSSGASVLGNSGQSNYGAGNGFMDALAHSRRKLGLNGQSICWGPLDMGMLENKEAVNRRLDDQGYVMIQKKDISKCLTQMLMLNEPQALMCRIDRQKMAEQMIRDNERTIMLRMKPFLQSVFNLLLDKDVGGKAEINMEVIRASTPKVAFKLLKSYLRKMVSDTALIEEKTLDLDVNMSDLGVDSMYAMSITGEILSVTGVRLSTHEIQFQSLNDATKLVLDQLGIAGSTEQQDDQLMNCPVSRGSIMTSIAKSIGDLDPDSEYNMGFAIVVSFDVIGIDATVMEQTVKEYISRHLICRSTLTIGKDDVISRELPLSEAFDFRLISGEDPSELQRNTEEPINLQQQGPVRFIYAFKIKRFLMIFHRYVFDLQAMTVLSNELQDILLAQLRGQTIPNNLSQDRDVTFEIQKVLARQYDKLKTFWALKMRSVPDSAFGSLSDCGVSSQQADITMTRTMNTSWYLQMKTFCNEQGVLPFELTVSIFQALLAFISGVSGSVTTLSVDLRSHVSSLIKSIGRCTNCVPIVCHLPEDSTSVKDFVKANKIVLEDYRAHALMPSEEIIKAAGRNIDHLIRRNVMLWEDETVSEDMTNLTIDTPMTFNHHGHTVLQVWHRRETKSVDFKFYVRKNLISIERADAILNAFVGLLSDTFDNPSVTLGKLKSRSYMIFGDKTQITRP